LDLGRSAPIGNDSQVQRGAHVGANYTRVGSPAAEFRINAWGLPRRHCSHQSDRGDGDRWNRDRVWRAL